MAPWFPSRPIVTEALAVTALTGVAIAARLVALGESPSGLQGDEAWLGLEARRILDQGWIGIWTGAGWGQPTGVFYWTAFLFALFPDDVTVLRASIAVLGAATVPALYLFLRSWYGRRAALIGAGLLAGSYWHIHYSRTAYTLVSAPLVECAVLLFLALGLKRQCAWPFVAAGILTGLGVYTYRGYMPFVFLMILLWGVILLARPYALRPLLRHAFLFGALAMLAAALMVIFVARHYGDYSGYGQLVSIFGNGQLQEAADQGETVQFLGVNSLRAAGTLYVGLYADPTDGMGASGLLDPMTAGLFTVGMVWSLRRWRDPRYFLIPTGVLLGLATVAMTVEWGENRRSIAALPMVFAAAGVGGDALLSLVQRHGFARMRLPSPGSTRPAMLISVAFAFAFAWNGWVYTAHLLPSDPMRHAYAADLREASRFLAGLPQEAHVYFYSHRWSWNYEARRFLAPGLEGEDRSKEFGEFTLDLDPNYPYVVYLLMPPYDEYAEEIEGRYPESKRIERVNEEELVFLAYIVEE